MKNLIIGGAVAAALALSPMTSRPAQALEGEELIGIVLGLAALSIIGQEISDNRRDRTRVHRKRHPVMVHSSRRHHRVLPASCLREVRGARRNFRVVGEHCLRRNNVSTSRLPDRCRIQVRAGGRLRTAYAMPCLYRAGYDVGRGGRHRR